MAVEPISAASVSGSVIKNALDGLGTTLGKQIGRFTKPIIDRAIVDLGIGFQSYLESSYNKCRYFKTILNQAQPLEVVPHYIHNNLMCGTKKVRDDQLINQIDDLKYVVITGLAGSGKSMMMKYLAICRFENPRGRIPLFVELRNLNSLNQRDLLEFIRASCTGKGHSVTTDQFNLALAAGAFVIILDGFDELNHEHRDDASKQILSLIQKYPDNPVIISSRQDDRFGGWTPFHVYQVTELSKAQSLKLIESLDYNPGVKKRFYKEVNSRLYESHQSFLSSPLLTTIMLLTYEEFAEIPIKMHAFYSQAFDTLFQKHDASKEQYQRKIHTGLGREDFKSTFAAFCAMSYLDQKFSFESDELASIAADSIKYIKQAKTGLPKSLDANSLIGDLKESVCLLQQDGLAITFVHRSFQEYFAALFVASLHGDKVRRVLDKYAFRFGDSVISMAMDMARETIEQEWVVKTIERIEAAICLNDEGQSLSRKYAMLFDEVILHTYNGGTYPSVRGLKDDVIGALETICVLYPVQLGGGLVVQGLRFDPKTYINVLCQSENEGKPGFDQFVQWAESTRGRGNTPHGEKALHFKFEEDHDWWLEIVAAGKIFDRMKKGFASIRRDIAARARKRRAILEDFLD